MCARKRESVKSRNRIVNCAVNAQYPKINGVCTTTHNYLPYNFKFLKIFSLIIITNFICVRARRRLVCRFLKVQKVINCSITTSKCELPHSLYINKLCVVLPYLLRLYIQFLSWFLWAGVLVFPLPANNILKIVYTVEKKRKIVYIPRWGRCLHIINENIHTFVIHTVLESLTMLPAFWKKI
jgi:hypothetical protein